MSKKRRLQIEMLEDRWLPSAVTSTSVSDSGFSTYGQNITFIASVTSNGSSVTKGTVDFDDGGSLLAGAVPLNSSGHATFTTTKLLLAGFHTITATYNDSSQTFSSSSGSDPLTVHLDNTDTALRASAAAVSLGQQVLISASVAPLISSVNTLTGSLALYDGDALLNITPLGVNGVVGTTVYSTSSLSAGVHTFTAQYTGDANHVGSTSSGVFVTVGMPALVSGASSTDSFASSTVALGDTDLLAIVVKDTSGNAVSGLPSSAFAFNLSGGTSAGTFGPATQTRTPGTYTTSFTGITAGTASTLTTTVEGVTLASQPTIQVIGEASSGSGGAIRGTVFHDYNTDGVQDPGEPGLAGQTLFLDGDGSGQLKAGDPTATTDTNGNYQFTGLSAGTYTVRQLLLGGALLSAPADNSYQMTLTSGTNVTGKNFADVLTSISVPLTLSPSTPFPKQGNANGDYVEALYRAILNRDADPSGLANWMGQLNSGALSRLQVVQGIRNSVEHFTQEVSDFYLTLLNRQPDPAGLQNWVQQLEGGMKEEQIAFYFLDSAEYLSQGDKHFVDAMYLSLLGRSFDAAGEANWLSQLGDDTSGNPTHPATLTHEQVVTDFLYSLESATRLTEGYYEVFLQRPADSAGLNGWVGQLQQGVRFLTIGQQFLSSDEFYNRAAQQG